MSGGVYGSSYAALYDSMYADKDYRAEAEFIDGLLRSEADRAGRLLDVACGTGRHAAELACKGYSVSGCDQSGDMIRIASERTRRLGLECDFFVARAESLTVPEPYAFTTCLFDSIGYAVTTDGVLSALRAIRSATQRGGLFVCEFWHAATMLRSFEPTRVRRIELPDAEMTRISRTRLDVARSIARVDYEVLLVRDGRLERFGETHENRFFGIPEFRHYLESSGFEPLRLFNGFSESGAIDAAWHVVVLSRAAGGG